MTQPAELIERCVSKGIRVYLAFSGELRAGPENLIDDALVSLLKENKPQLIRYLSKPERIPCQVQWVPECLGPKAQTELIRPERFGYGAGPDQFAAVCAGCQAVLGNRATGRQDRQQEKHVHRENLFLWAVLRTQAILKQ